MKVWLAKKPPGQATAPGSNDSSQFWLIEIRSCDLSTVGDCRLH
jgi:hypothetical protein